MTERLSALLHAEADVVDVPPPSTAAVLRRGRAARRRRRTTGAVAGLVVVGALAGAGVALAPAGDDEVRSVDPATSPGDTGATFTIGTTLWYDDASRRAVIDDKAVKSIYSTSAGVLVRHGENNWSDGGGPQRFSLVTPDGEVRRLGLVTEEVAHTTDPGQPYVAWGDPRDGSLVVVVHDVAADREVARVPVPEADGAYFATLELVGDTAYVRALSEDGGERHFALDWRTGEVTPRDLEVTDVGGGRGVAGPSIVELDSGAEVWSSAQRNAYLDLSPDGRHVLVQGGGWQNPTFTVVAVDGGSEPMPLDPPASRYSWTAGSELMSVTADAVTTCDPASGACEELPVDLGVTEEELLETLRPIGAVFES
ncbi:hypothetical protein G6553_04010 [Nocardioides sp. IC4_145]|uniref:hypothetical protein n=1 Tax=Nocardioides sp. IC4_145 TaxID=2714037 RepID=UPI00140AC4FC|nr:hypothetical protein [Nocardioides sp. IC4_145]NHC22340.1 hypothetical protein [Nocardioides sp. IC4_145]